MISKRDYLKLAIDNKAYNESSWFFSTFAITNVSPESWKDRESYYPGKITRLSTGYFLIVEKEEGLELEQIEAGDKDSPLFGPADPIEVDSTWAINIKPGEVVQTTIPTLLVNLIMLVDVYGSKIPFVDKKFSQSKIEAYIIANRTDEPEHDTKITLQEFLKQSYAVEYVRTLMPLFCHSLTEKNMTTPDGLSELKAKRLKELGDSIKDPVVLAKFEAELLDVAKEYLKDDPSMGKLVRGKILGNSIRKMFISSGAEGGMGGEMVPVLDSLSDGIDYSPETFQAIVNGARSGSYFRGMDTVKGGVSFKLVVRVLSSFTVKDTDCKSNLGLEIEYNKQNITGLVGRTLLGSNKRVETLEEAEDYIGAKLMVRSAGFCKTADSSYCRVCAGERLFKFAEGLAIPAAEVTGIILAASMAAMHKNTVEVTEFDLEQCFS